MENTISESDHYVYPAFSLLSASPASMIGTDYDRRKFWKENKPLRSPKIHFCGGGLKFFRP